MADRKQGADDGFHSEAAAAYYDFLNNRDEAQEHLNFLLKLVLPPYGSAHKWLVLDAGSGTGRIGIPFAEHRLNVTCVDPSREMTNACLIKVAQKPELFPYITVVCADPATMQLKPKFDFVSLFWALIYICDEKQRVQTVKNLRAHMKPGGRFLIDGTIGFSSFRPDMGPYENTRLKVGRREYVQVFESKKVGELDYHLKVEFKVLEDGELVESFVTEVGGRSVPGYDYLKDLLGQAGLEIEQAWGDGGECYVPWEQADQSRFIVALAKEKGT